MGALLERTDLNNRLSSIELINCKEPVISHSDIVYSMVGLQSIGKPDYDAIEPFREVPFFSQSLGINHSPSSSTLRQRLGAVEDAFDTIIKEESAGLIRNTAPGIKTVSTSGGAMVPLDIDVSPFDFIRMSTIADALSRKIYPRISNLIRARQQASAGGRDCPNLS